MPRHLRGRQRVSPDEMARRLGVSRASLLLLESTPTTAWKIETLVAYVRALGLALELRALDPGNPGAKAVIS